MPEIKALTLVARYEYMLRVKSKSFLGVTFGLPLLYLLIFGIIMLYTGSVMYAQIGYVDQAHLFPATPQMPPLFADFPQPQAFPDVASGRQALEEGTITALYVLPPDYWQGGTVIAYKGNKHAIASDFFADFIRVNLVSSVDDANARARLLDGPHYVSEVQGTDQAMGGIHTVRMVIALIAGGMFYLLLTLSGTYLLQAVSDEKENRTLEMIVTSISTRALILGKMVGLIVLSLTQLAIWGAAILVGGIYVLTSPAFPIPITLEPSLIPWRELGLLTAFFLPTFLLVASLMVALGGIANDQRQGQQYSGIFTMLFFIPLYFIAQLIAEPNGLLAIGLTLFPCTSLSTLMIRRAIGVVPPWQIWLSWGLLTGTALAVALVTPRIFRWGMLRTGQGLSLKKLRLALLGQGGRHA